MKLIVNNLLHAKSCSFGAVAVALATMAASNAAAEKVRVFNETVTGVPAANPVVVSDNVFSPEFTPGLVVQGVDLLENTSGIITQYGYLSDGTNTDLIKTLISFLIIIRVAPRLTMIMAGISCSRDMRTAGISLTSRGSTWMWRVPIIASRS